MSHFFHAFSLPDLSCRELPRGYIPSRAPRAVLTSNDYDILYISFSKVYHGQSFPIALQTMQHMYHRDLQEAQSIMVGKPDVFAGVRGCKEVVLLAVGLGRTRLWEV